MYTLYIASIVFGSQASMFECVPIPSFPSPPLPFHRVDELNLASQLLRSTSTLKLEAEVAVLSLHFRQQARGLRQEVALNPPNHHRHQEGEELKEVRSHTHHSNSNSNNCSHLLLRIEIISRRHGNRAARDRVSR